jgi:glycosyltransferase involved in cell wall biosynthesis
LEPTLSVLLPIYNAQRILGQMMAQLIEILPELTPRFEMLIIDDGSTDATSEVAHELAMDYPQIGVVTHPTRLGAATAIRTGLSRTSGEMVLIRDEDCRADVYDIPKLWRHATSHDIVLARVPSQSMAGFIPRLPAGMVMKMPTEMRPPLQLLHRRVTRGWLTLGGNEELVAHLVRKGYPLLEVDVRDAKPALTPAALIDTLIARMPQPTEKIKTPKLGEPRRPNYLAKIKAFALGE